MVSVSIYEVSGGQAYSTGLCFEYGGRKYLALVGAPYPGRPAVVIASIDDHTLTPITIEDPDCDVEPARIIPVGGSLYRIDGTHLKIRVLYARDASDQVVCADYDIDLESMTGSLSEVWTQSITGTLNPGMGAVVEEFSEILFPLTDAGTVYILDMDTGGVKDSFDSGFGEYNPRASYKIKRTDSSYIALFGKHLAGDPFYRFDRSAKSLTAIPGSSADGDSPNPGACEPFKTGGEVLYYPATGATVEGSSPDLVWFDGSLNLLGKTDLSGIYANAHLKGMVVVGRLGNGNLACILWVGDDHFNVETESEVLYAEVDTSTWSIVSSQVLHREAGMEYDGPFCVFHGRCGPVYVDVEAGKMWVLGKKYELGSGNVSSVLYEFDLGGLDVSEWNEWHTVYGLPAAPTGWEWLQTLMDLMNSLMYLVLFILVLSLLVSSMREAKRPAEE